MSLDAVGRWLRNFKEKVSPARPTSEKMSRIDYLWAAMSHEANQKTSTSRKRPILPLSMKGVSNNRK